MKPFPFDPYCYPGTSVLRNLNGIRDPSELEAFEAAMVAVRLVRLTEQPIEGPFDAARLQETHRRIFGGVYEWAGKFRKNTGTMTKQRETGHLVTYGDSAYIEAGLAAAFEKLKLEKFLRGLTPAAFGLRAAHFYGEFDAVHPFREGNSRTLRQFFSDVAKQAGYKINWTAASTTELQRQHFILARDLAVVRGDSSVLAQILAMHLDIPG